jgi:hypothetical protein
MLSRKFVAPLRLELRTSRLFRFYLIGIHNLGLLSVLLPSALPWYARVLIVMLVCGSAAVCWRAYHTVHSNREGFHWIWRDTDRWLQMANDSLWQMLPAYYLSPYLLVIRLANDAGQKRYLFIFADQLPATVYHQLYLRLKFWHNSHDYSAGVT